MKRSLVSVALAAALIAAIAVPALATSPTGTWRCVSSCHGGYHQIFVSDSHHWNAGSSVRGKWKAREGGHRFAFKVTSDNGESWSAKMRGFHLIASFGTDGSPVKVKYEGVS